MEKEENHMEILRRDLKAKAGVYVFKVGESSVGVIMPGNALDLDVAKIKTVVPAHTGLSLVMASLPKERLRPVYLYHESKSKIQ